MLTKMEFFKELAANAGMKADLFVMIIFLFFPLFTAPIYLLLNNAPTRHLFDIVVGSFVLWAVYGFEASLHFYALCVLALLISRFGASQAPKLMWVCGFGYLGARHFIRYAFAAEDQSYDVDITGPMMILVLKVISLVYTLRDQAADTKRKAPSIIELCGYFLHHSTLIAGPIIKLDEYQTYTSLDRKSLPSGLKHAGLKFLEAMVWFALHVRFNMLSDDHIGKLTDDEFVATMSFVQRLWFMHLYTSVLRIKFYAAWAVGECSMTLAGWGYNKQSNKWELVNNVKPLDVELGQNARQTINNWNIRVSEWLRVYVMEKCPDRNLGTLLAFVVSAVWHGFSVTQYTFFVLAGVYLLVVAKNVRKAFHPLATSLFGGKLKIVYDIAGIVFHMLTFSFIGLAWANDTVSGMLTAWRNMYYFGFVVCAVGYALSNVVISFQPKQPRADKKEKDTKTKKAD